MFINFIISSQGAELVAPSFYKQNIWSNCADFGATGDFLNFSQQGNINFLFNFNFLSKVNRHWWKFNIYIGVKNAHTGVIIFKIYMF